MNTPARLPSPAARLRALAAQPVARNIGKVLTGNLAGNGLNMLAQMVISRVLDAGLFGMFSVLQRTMMFIGQFADLGLNTTIVKYYQQYARGGEREKAEALMRHALWLRLGLLGAMIALALALAGPLETLLITDERARGWMRLACAGAAGYALWMFCQAAMQAREQFGPYAVLGTANHALRLGLVAGFAWAGYLTLGAAVWIMVAVPIVGVASAAARWPAAFWSARIEPRERREKTAEVLRFSKWIFISSATTTLIMSLDVMMLAALLEDNGVQAGYFGRAALFAQLFPQISAAVSTVLLPRLAATRDAAEMQRLTRRIMKFVPIVALGVGAIILGGEWFFPWFYGADGATSAHVFALLAAGMALSIVLNPLSFFFMAFEKPHWLTQMNVAQLVLNLGLNWVLIPRYGAVGAAGATLAVRLFAVFYLWAGYRRLLKIAANQKQ